MDALDGLFEGEAKEWLNTLPAYQLQRVEALLHRGLSEEKIAELWVTANIENTAFFGTEGRKSIFLASIKKELWSYICDADAYVEEKKKWLSCGEIVKTSFISCVTFAIAPKLGASAVFIAPVIALLFCTISRVSLAAWCNAVQSESEIVK